MVKCQCFVSAWVSVINTCLSLITDFMSVSNLVRSEVRSKVRSKVRTENTIFLLAANESGKDK